MFMSPSVSLPCSACSSVPPEFDSAAAAAPSAASPPLTATAAATAAATATAASQQHSTQANAIILSQSQQTCSNSNGLFRLPPVLLSLVCHFCDVWGILSLGAAHRRFRQAIHGAPHNTSIGNKQHQHDQHNSGNSKSISNSSSSSSSSHNPWLHSHLEAPNVLSLRPYHPFATWCEHLPKLRSIVLPYAHFSDDEQWEQLVDDSERICHALFEMSFLQRLTFRGESVEYWLEFLQQATSLTHVEFWLTNSNFWQHPFARKFNLDALHALCSVPNLTRLLVDCDDRIGCWDEVFNPLQIIAESRVAASLVTLHIRGSYMKESESRPDKLNLQVLPNFQSLRALKLCFVQILQQDLSRLFLALATIPHLSMLSVRLLGDHVSDEAATALLSSPVGRGLLSRLEWLDLSIVAMSRPVLHALLEACTSLLALELRIEYVQVPEFRLSYMEPPPPSHHDWHSLLLQQRDALLTSSSSSSSSFPPVVSLCSSDGPPPAPSSAGSGPSSSAAKLRWLEADIQCVAPHLNTPVKTIDSIVLFDTHNPSHHDDGPDRKWYTCSEVIPVFDLCSAPLDLRRRLLWLHLYCDIGRHHPSKSAAIRDQLLLRFPRAVVYAQHEDLINSHQVECDGQSPCVPIRLSCASESMSERAAAASRLPWLRREFVSDEVSAASACARAGPAAPCSPPRAPGYPQCAHDTYVINHTDAEWVETLTQLKRLHPSTSPSHWPSPSLSLSLSHSHSHSQALNGAPQPSLELGFDSSPPFFSVPHPVLVTPCVSRLAHDALENTVRLPRFPSCPPLPAPNKNM